MAEDFHDKHNHLGEHDGHDHDYNKHEHDDETNSDDADDVNIDFSKIKKFFSMLSSKKPSSKIAYTLLILLLIAIPVVATILIRLQPMYLPVTDQWAQSSVANYYRNAITQQVNTQYPNLPTANKNTLVDKQLADFEKTNKDNIAQQVKQTSDYFKTGFRYQENNVTYTFLGDLDSYYYLRQARNIIDKGYVCDAVVDGVCKDTYMIAPIGTTTGPSLHPYAIAYLYKFLKMFSPDINLMSASFLVPTIVACLCAIFAFFIGRRIMNDAAGFFAAMFVSLSPLFITRTLGSDTDVWNIVFPLLIIWMFLEAFESKGMLKRIVFTVLAGFFIGLFAFAWSAWWYIFDFIIVALVIYIAFELLRSYIKHKQLFSKNVVSDLKNVVIIFVLLIISSALFTTMFNSFGSFTSAISAPLQLSATLKVAAYENLWPNVLTTVAELNAASISTIVSQIAFGINILFSLALLGIIFTMVKKKPDFKEYLLIGFSILLFLFLITSSALAMNSLTYIIILSIPIIIALVMLLREKESEIDIRPALILTVWFVGMIYASAEGLRFILLLTPVFGIAIGVALGYIYQYFVGLFHSSFKLKENLAKLIVFALLCLLLISPVQTAISSSDTYIPSITKGWWDSLTKIRLQSKPDSIINSWWDFGHWFKYVANRRVTLDGASQNHPAAQWLGRILQTNNENESVAILRMLDCGSNTAFDEIDKRYNDTEKSQNIVAEIMLMTKDDAAKDLAKYGYSSAEIDKILSLTHCSPPDDYFVTSEDMVGKAGVWAHFGLWDFDKAYIINNVRTKPLAEALQIMKDRWNYSEDYASKIYYDVQALQTDQEMNDWIAPWPSYAGGKLTACTNDSDIVTCNLNLGISQNAQQMAVVESAIVNISNPESSYVIIGFYDTTTNTKLQQTTGAFSQVVIATDKYRQYNISNGTIGISLLLDVENNSNQTTYNALVADPNLIESTFTKLFFLNGKGMQHFEKFSDTTDITGQRIIIWKVKW
jgi:dolichyl-diphosphooligosaccharide--protein glycosyltransferase